MKSGLQKQNSKSDSNSVSIQMELKDIADAFCILPEDINKKKVDFSLELMNQVIRAGYTNEDPQKISDNTLIGICCGSLSKSPRLAFEITPARFRRLKLAQIK